MASSWPLTRRRFFIILLSSITGPAVFWLTTNKGGGLHFPHLCICLFTFLPISVFQYLRICVFSYHFRLQSLSFCHPAFLSTQFVLLNWFCFFKFNNSASAYVLQRVQTNHVNILLTELNYLKDANPARANKFCLPSVQPVDQCTAV